MKLYPVVNAFADIASLPFRVLFLLASTGLMIGAVYGQNIDSVERGRAKDMLHTVKSEIKKNYYDAEFHGVDLDARFKAAEDSINQAASIGQIQGIIAQAVMDLNDSHTIFLPPQTTVRVDYGWQMRMIGDKCFVIAVKPGSNAEEQGLKPGDEILAVESFHPNRKEFWKMRYYYYALSKRAGMQLLVQSPTDAAPRQLNVRSKVTQLKQVVDINSNFDFWDLIRESEGSGEYHRFKTVGNTVIWKMPSFNLDPKDVDSIMRERVSGKSAMILDLRGNPGGLIIALEQLVGYFFDKDVKIADLKGRKAMDPLKGKTQGSNVFNGKLVVLTDSDSASCSEIFSRLVQIEKRGVVIGDNSAGAVMQARTYNEQVGTDRIVFYGVEITNADVIMSDGKSLEHIGVIPDELLNPTGADISARRDTVLARAFETLGQKISPEDAGKIFPVEWDK